jgi:hypothetical protein
VDTPASPRRILEAQRHWAIVDAIVTPLLRGARSPSRETIMLKATEEENEEVREYFDLLWVQHTNIIGAPNYGTNRAGTA